MTAIYNIPTTVTLSNFAAQPGAWQITLASETATEIDNLGFNLYRSDQFDAPYTQLNETLIPSRAPGSPTGANYEWVDHGVTAGTTYFYQLEAVDLRGGPVRFGPISASRQSHGRYIVYLPLIKK